MRRILLVLAVAAMFGAVAAPSAAAQEGPQFCYYLENPDGEFGEPGAITFQPSCYDTMAQCELARSLEPAGFDRTPSSCSPEATPRATDSESVLYPSMKDCKDQSRDPQSCRAD